jgi:DnaK suppressor protein
VSKTPARTSSAKPAAKTSPVATAGKKAAASAKVPAKAASTQSPPAKAPKASAAPARKSHVDSPEPVSTSKAPTAKSAAKPAPAKTAAAPAASKPATAKAAAAPAPAAAAPAPHPVVSSPSPAKASFASSLAERASSSATMNKTPVLDQPRPAAAPADPKLANAWKAKAGRDLTDAEVLAMPDAEYMGDKQLEFFRTKLERLKDDLLSNAGETTEHLREDTTIVPDPADRATIEEEHALELRTRDRERKLLKKISQALTRIDAGDYGFCDETGEPIGLGRLIARPTATLSLEAQQRRELKQKMFGD